MTRISRALSIMFLLVLSGCASGYGSLGITGGYSEDELESGIWRISYYGNGVTTQESVQTYWLYRAAELATQKGYDGFEIISAVQMISFPVAPDPASGAKLYPAAAALLYVPDAQPSMIADIRILKKPLAVSPPKVFDAVAFKAALEPYVKGKLCHSGNVCPHIHHYLMPAPPSI